MIILYLSVCYPLTILYQSFCDPILYLSILGFRLMRVGFKGKLPKYKDPIKWSKSKIAGDAEHAADITDSKVRGWGNSLVMEMLCIWTKVNWRRLLLYIRPLFSLRDSGRIAWTAAYCHLKQDIDIIRNLYKGNSNTVTIFVNKLRSLKNIDF